MMYTHLTMFRARFWGALARFTAERHRRTFVRPSQVEIRNGRLYIQRRAA
jgi:hypothetical protein